MMVFKCQQDSFLKEYEGTVLSCEPAEWASDSKTILNGFNVILDDTILFPEGGGQPCDFGKLNNFPVRNVVRKGREAVHFVECGKPFFIGEKVKQTIDWPRRLDNMQQHSGQHLITALFYKEYNYDTSSWWLGKNSSYIELEAKNVTKEQLQMIETLANALILEERKVTVTLLSAENMFKLENLRAPRDLPSDHVGEVRIVSIKGVENNRCCGTHVTNLSKLQAIKLLYCEKAKGKVYVHFVVGNRVVKMLDETYEREMKMNTVLKGGAPSHIELVQKMQQNLKVAQKNVQKMMKEIALYEAEKLKAQEPLPKYFSLHRKDGIEPDFINSFLRAAPKGIFYFLILSENISKGAKGHMVLRGEPELIKKFGPTFAELLDGKGNGKMDNFQAKVNDLSKVKECETLLRDFFK